MDAVLDHARTLPGFLSFGETYNAAVGSAEPYGFIRIVSMMQPLCHQQKVEVGTGIISYTSVGGFSAVATMDLIQSIIMTIALAIIVVFGIVHSFSSFSSRMAMNRTRMWGMPK